MENFVDYDDLIERINKAKDTQEKRFKEAKSSHFICSLSRTIARQ